MSYSGSRRKVFNIKDLVYEKQTKDTTRRHLLAYITIILEMPHLGQAPPSHAYSLDLLSVPPSPLLGQVPPSHKYGLDLLSVQSRPHSGQAPRSHAYSLDLWAAQSKLKQLENGKEFHTMALETHLQLPVEINREIVHVARTLIPATQVSGAEGSNLRPAWVT